jgi:tRNA G18 (ribose-2'-O)-methylase SpoU
VQLIEVTDTGDERLDDFRDLTDADVRPDRRGVVIAEGINVVERLILSPYCVRAVFGVPARIEALRRWLEPLDVQVFVADKWLLSQVVGFRVTRGVLASATRPAALEPAALLATARHVAVLEALNDFENLGSLFRNAAAFGVDAEPWPESLELLRAHDLSILAMTPGGAVDLRDFTAPERWALLLGAEGPGLTEEALAASDHRIRIPMATGVDSLNVATAAAVAFAHLV